MFGTIHGTVVDGSYKVADAGVLRLLQAAAQLVPQHGDKLLLAQSSISVLE